MFYWGPGPIFFWTFNIFCAFKYNIELQRYVESGQFTEDLNTMVGYLPSFDDIALFAESPINNFIRANPYISDSWIYIPEAPRPRTLEESCNMFYDCYTDYRKIREPSLTYRHPLMWSREIVNWNLEKGYHNELSIIKQAADDIWAYWGSPRAYPHSLHSFDNKPSLGIIFQAHILPQGYLNNFIWLTEWAHEDFTIKPHLLLWLNNENHSFVHKLSIGMPEYNKVAVYLDQDNHDEEGFMYMFVLPIYWGMVWAETEMSVFLSLDNACLVSDLWNGAHIPRRWFDTEWEFTEEGWVLHRPKNPDKDPSLNFRPFANGLEMDL